MSVIGVGIEKGLPDETTKWLLESPLLAGFGFFITAACPNLLSFFTYNNCCSGVLAEGKNSFCCNFGITKHSKCYILVVIASLRV